MSQHCFQRKSKIKRETSWHAYPFFGSFSVKSQWNNDDFSSCSKKNNRYGLHGISGNRNLLADKSLYCLWRNDSQNEMLFYLSDTFVIIASTIWNMASLCHSCGKRWHIFFVIFFSKSDYKSCFSLRLDIM